jgi:hypothetical protein
VLRNVTGGKANVRHSAEFFKHGFRYARSQHHCAQKTRGRGRFTSMTGAILLVFVVSVVLNPWALRIGGRQTPARLTRLAVGKLQSTSGADYGLFIEVNLYLRPRGAAKLCTREGKNLSAEHERFYIKQLWLDVDRKRRSREHGHVLCA